MQTNQGSQPPVAGWRGSGVGGGPGTTRSAPQILGGAVPSLLSTQCLKLAFLLVFCQDSSLMFPSYFLSIHSGGRRFCLTTVSDILFECPQAGTTLSPVRTYLTLGTLGTSMRRSTLVLSVPEHPKSRSEKQRGTARPRREASLAGSRSARALPGGTHALWQARCFSGALRLSKPQAGGLNDDAGGTWNTPGT